MSIDQQVTRPAARPESTGPVDDRSRVRVDAAAKVTGSAPYAYEQPVDNPAYMYPLV